MQVKILFLGMLKNVHILCECSIGMINHVLCECRGISVFPLNSECLFLDIHEKNQ